MSKLCRTQAGYGRTRQNNNEPYFSSLDIQDQEAFTINTWMLHNSASCFCLSIVVLNKSYSKTVLIPPGHYFDFYIVCTIYLNGTNCMRMSLNFVPLVVHCILNMLFPLVKLFVANGDEHPHYSWKKQNTTQQYCSLLVPPGAASNCRKGVSILYLFNTIWRKIQVYLVRILGPFHWQ